MLLFTSSYSLINRKSIVYNKLQNIQILLTDPQRVGHHFRGGQIASLVKLVASQSLVTVFELPDTKHNAEKHVLK